MEKKYNHTPESSGENKVSEPIASYTIDHDTEIQLPLTEEELKNCITGDELREHMIKFIDKLFDNQ